MITKTGRPRKNPDSLRVTKGFSISSDNLQYITDMGQKQQKNVSEVLNNIIETIRKLRGE